jgi:uncharacterized protein with HEPN domain
MAVTPEPKELRDIADQIARLKAQRMAVNNAWQAARPGSKRQEELRRELVLIGETIATLKDRSRTIASESEHRRLATFVRMARRKFGDDAVNEVWAMVAQDMETRRKAMVGAALPVIGASGSPRQRSA